MLSNLISSYVDVAPNEYVTKYAFNRNFEKLISNDILLYTEISANNEKLYVQTYNKNREYKSGDLVLYKLRKDSTSLYLLSSVVTPNFHKPLVKETEEGKLVVINGNYWKIVGIDDFKFNTSKKDDAEEWTYAKKKQFNVTHQDNEDFHPTGKLSQKDSSMMFTNMENISEYRKTFMYPYRLESLIGDNHIQTGYMRVWENGILEYDIIYKFGKVDGSKDGEQPIMSANTLVPQHVNKNYLYFQKNEDYNIFNQPGKYYVNTSESKQVGLNNNTNVYEATLNFPEEFKDLNYMVFGSQIKQIETEAYNSTLDLIKDYDKRLTIKGLTITSVDIEASFKATLNIPSAVVNIAREGLAYIEETNGYPVSIDISKDAKIVNIDSYAFYSSEMSHLTIPYATRYIGEKAFGSCRKLTDIDIYVEHDTTKQPKIHVDAFRDCDSLSAINFYYRPYMMMATLTDDQRENVYSDTIDIYEKFSDLELRSLYGLDDVNINQYGKTSFSHPIPMMMASAPTSYSQNNDNFIENDISNEIDLNNTVDDNFFTIDVQDFLAELNGAKKPKLKFASAPVFVEINERQLSDYFHIYDNVITGCNIDTMSADSPLNLTVNDVTAIATNAISNNNYISTITFSNSLSLAQSAIISSNFDTFSCNSNNNIFDTSCLLSSRITDMFLNMENSYLSIRFGVNSTISYISVDNILSAKTKQIGTNINTCGFAKSSFDGTSTKSIQCYNNNYSEISGCFEMKNNQHSCFIDIGDSSMIKTNNADINDIRYVYNQRISAIPSFFTYNRTMLKSTNFNFLRANSINKIMIPLFTSQLCSTAISPNNITSYYTTLEKITIPANISKIGDKAFYNNKSTIIEFQEGSQLSSIGTNCFSNCSSLTSLVIK